MTRKDRAPSVSPVTHQGGDRNIATWVDSPLHDWFANEAKSRGIGKSALLRRIVQALHDAPHEIDRFLNGEHDARRADRCTCTRNLGSTVHYIGNPISADDCWFKWDGINFVPNHD